MYAIMAETTEPSLGIELRYRNNFMHQTIPDEIYQDPQALKTALRKCGLSLKPEEAQKIRERLHRAPTLAELFVFDIEWSEHCSYKSSRHLLKKYLPVSGPYVIQGPEEDAGIVEFTTFQGKRYGIVFAHESHNHPSQVLPFEGAATGIGGIVRDVDCMGATVIGVADPLRFGDPNGENAVRTRAIVDGVVDGIRFYGNALGVPNLGGDVVFHPGYDDNCLVNVVALGILSEEEIIHSRVPRDGAGYDVILIGKPTDRSGFGGATFSSDTLDQEDEEENKGAVQIPDPFLKNVLLLNKATHHVRQVAKERGIPIGMKDLGAGGIACCSSEIAAHGGFGLEIDLEKVHVAEPQLPPEVILCAETQERYILTVPPAFTPEVLRIYNEEWDLPSICSGAGARVIGKILSEPVMRVILKGETVVEAPIEYVVEGIRYQRESRPPQRHLPEPVFEQPRDLNEVVLKLLGAPNIASKDWIYHHYDMEVQGNTVIRPGEADASLLMPLDGCPAGVALSVDGNPYYGDISPFWGGVNAIAESMRNVAAIGATPRAFTDCLNFGNPEVPEDFWALENAIQGLAEAARSLFNPAEEPHAVPFVSGNVSLYNQSASGKSIPPSPIIACVGVIPDAAKAITMEIKRPDTVLLLVGERKHELGGSEYYRALNLGLGSSVPQPNYEAERGIIYGTIAAIDQGLVLSAHDISNGGMLTSAAEMLLATHPDDTVGLELDLRGLNSALRDDLLLFSESGGMLLEVAPEQVDAVRQTYRRLNAPVYPLGKTTASPRLRVLGKQGDVILELALAAMRNQWRGAYGITPAS
jgi:phosphoribosylformylglycinamidine synthase